MIMNKKLRVMCPAAILQNFIFRTNRKVGLEPVPGKKKTFQRKPVFGTLLQVTLQSNLLSSEYPILFLDPMACSIIS
jgi:hypothetical protein